MDPDLLRSTWAEVAKHGDRVPKWFYGYLFLRHREVRHLFPGVMGDQHDKFVAALGRIVSNADNLTAVVPVLQHLGRSHRRFGAIEDHYPAVGEALIATIEHFLGDQWNDDIGKNWTDAYRIVSDVMIAAAREADQHDEPQWWDSRIRYLERQHDIAYIVFDAPETLPLDDGPTIPVALNAKPGSWLPVQPFDVDGGWAIYVEVNDNPITLALAQAQPGAQLRIGAPLPVEQEDQP